MTERFTGPQALTDYFGRFGTFVVNPIVYSRIPENVGNYVDELKNLSFSRLNLLIKVSVYRNVRRKTIDVVKLMFVTIKSSVISLESQYPLGWPRIPASSITGRLITVLTRAVTGRIPEAM